MKLAALLASFSTIYFSLPAFAAPRESGPVALWGLGSQGDWAVPAGTGACIAAEAGSEHIVVLRPDGAVRAWGRNFERQCNVDSFGPCSAIAAGWNHTLGIRTDGSAVGCGDNSKGQITIPAALGICSQLTAANEFSVALKIDGSLAAWGTNSYGALSTPSIGRCQQVSADGDWTDGHVIALTENGAVFAWGNNRFGQTTVPPGLGLCRAVAAGGNFSIALKTDGSVAAWGANDNGQSQVPADLGQCTSISAGYRHVSAIRADGGVRCWGWNQYGQTNVPPPLGSCIRISAGNVHTVAIQAPPPTIIGVTPISGPSSGGTPITISGTHFTNPSEVRIGGASATSVVVVSPNTITAVTPAGFPGSATVSVNDGSALAFYYRPECGSDLDQDGEVTAADIAIVLLDFGPCYQTPLAAPAPEVPPLLDAQPLPDAPRQR